MLCRIFFGTGQNSKAGPCTYVSTVEKKSMKFEKLRLKADALKLFAQRKNYNPDICFLIDMSIPSGKKRFFVYNIEKDSIMLEGLVAHGSCDNGFQAEPYFFQ